MLIRTVAGIASLYVWGNPTLDSVRPPEIDMPSRAVYQAFEPAVRKTFNFAEGYVPSELRHARINHPLMMAGSRLGKTGL